MLSDFSKPVPAGCRVELEIEIGADYSMRVTVSVPSAGIKKLQDVKLQPIKVPSAEELEAEFAKLRQDFESLLQNMPAGEQKAAFAAEGEGLIEEIETQLKGDFPEHLQTYLLLKKLLVHIKEKGRIQGLHPPKNDMDEKFAKCQELLPKALSKKPALSEQHYDKTLAALQEEATRAYQQNDAQVWSHIARKLDEIAQDLERALQGEGPGLAEIPVFVVLNYVRQASQEVRAKAAQRSAAGQLTSENAARCNRELDTADQKVGQVDLSNDQAAKQQLIVIYQQHVMAAERIAGLAAGSSGGVITHL